MMPAVPDLVLTGALAVVLLRISVIDYRTYRLPDLYTVPLIVVGIALNAARAGGIPWPSILGAVAGFAIFALIGALFYRIRRVDGLGLGDAKLLAAAGAWLGLKPLPLVVLVGALGALIAALLARTSRDTRIAFGPWLAAAFWGVWVVQEVLHRI